MSVRVRFRTVKSFNAFIYSLGWAINLPKPFIDIIFIVSFLVISTDFGFDLTSFLAVIGKIMLL